MPALAKFDEARKHLGKRGETSTAGAAGMGGWKREETAGPRRETTTVETLVAKPILIYVASELEFVNFHQSPGLVKGI